MPKEASGAIKMSRKKCEIISVAVVGTGSKGNAYLVQVGDSKLLLDAGIPMAKIRKYNNNKVTDIDAMLVTHAHNDHSQYMQEFMNMGVRLIYGVDKIDCGKFVVCGEYQKHDIECRGYAIDFADKGIMLHYITDTVEPIVSAEFLCDNRRHYWIIECNYTDETMRYNDEHESASVGLRNVRTRETHLSDKTVIDFFKSSNIPASAVLFVHRSELNFDYKVFRKAWNKELPNLNMAVAENCALFEFCGNKIEQKII